MGEKESCMCMGVYSTPFPGRKESALRDVGSEGGVASESIFKREHHLYPGLALADACSSKGHRGTWRGGGGVRPESSPFL